MMLQRVLAAVSAMLMLSACAPGGELPPPGSAGTPAAETAAQETATPEVSPVPTSVPETTPEATPIPAPTPEVTPIPAPVPEAAPSPVAPVTAGTVTVGKDSGSPYEIALPVRGPVVEGLPLSGKLICIDPGHGVTPLLGKGITAPVSPLSSEKKAAYVTGTQGKYMTEEQLDLKVSLKLRDRLEALGATVLMTRETSKVTINNIERCELANAAGADVHLHIHADGSTNASVHGVSVLVPTGSLLGTPSIKEESGRLGKLMVDAVAAQTGAKNLGTIGRSDLSGLNYSQVPSVFLEMGYMTNAAEDEKLSTDAYQDQIVEGIVQSLISWYGVGE